MQKIVLDTNIVVSALLTPFGPPACVLDLILGGNLLICFDSRILAEYEAVLARPKFDFDKHDVKAFINFIFFTGFSVTPEPLNIIMQDEDDKMFYEVAKHCGALLVTGNRKHYPDDCMVLSPTEFLGTL